MPMGKIYVNKGLITKFRKKLYHKNLHLQYGIAFQILPKENILIWKKFSYNDNCAKTIRADFFIANHCFKNFSYKWNCTKNYP